MRNQYLIHKQDKNCDKWTDQNDTSVGERKIVSYQQESNPWPPEHREGAWSTELQELTESHLTEFKCDRHSAYC